MILWLQRKYIEISTEKTSKRKVFISANKPVKVWQANVDNIVISKLIQTKTNSKYLIGIKFEKVLRSLVLTMHKMSGYAKTFKVKGGYKDKNNKINYCLSIKMMRSYLKYIKLFGLDRL